MFNEISNYVLKNIYNTNILLATLFIHSLNVIFFITIVLSILTFSFGPFINLVFLYFVSEDILRLNDYDKDVAFIVHLISFYFWFAVFLPTQTVIIFLLTVLKYVLMSRIRFPISD